MPRKSRKKATEPTSVAEVLEQSPIAAMIAEHQAPAAEQSPAVAERQVRAAAPETQAPTLDAFLASREAKSRLDPEREMPEPEPGDEAVQAFKRQREREMAGSQSPAPQTETARDGQETQGRTHVERLSEPRGLRPAPTGFKGLEGHYAAGIRLNRSLDKNVVGIQFADDQKPTRHGPDAENQQLRDQGFLYVPMRTQWERVDRERPADNYQDAKQFVETLAKTRRESLKDEVER